MVKPFSSMQSPEAIAKEYAGNKQKIAQAMQMGVVDPTAGVLAGMFIDRMRGAQAQEGANPPTVAQQVMGGAPPAPAVPPSAGIGGTSPAGAPPMAPPMPGGPPMGAPPMGAPMPEAPPMGMAMGGLTSLPVPDAMFDEPDNGGYAGGGIVAFDEGGSVGWGDYIEQMARKVDPNIQISGRARTTGRNAQVGGVPNSYHLIDAARDIRTPEGMDKNEFIAKLKGVFGPGYDVLPSKGRSVHVEPGPELGKKVRAGSAPSPAPAQGASPMGLSVDIPSILDKQAEFRDVLTQNMIPETKRRQELATELEGATNPEVRKEERDSRRWEALAQFGFQLAQQPGSLLQAASAAASQVLPTLRKGDEQMREQLREDQKMLMQLEDKGNDEKQRIEMLAFELAKAEAGLLSDERKLELGYILAQQSDSTQRALANMSNLISMTIAERQNQTSRDVAGIRAEAVGAGNPFLDPDLGTAGGSDSGSVSFNDLK